MTQLQRIIDLYPTYAERRLQRRDAILRRIAYVVVCLLTWACLFILTNMDLVMLYDMTGSLDLCTLPARKTAEAYSGQC